MSDVYTSSISTVESATASLDTSGTTDNSTTEETPSERPAWLPEKFKTAEDFAKSYTELEKKLGQSPTQKTVQTPLEPVADKDGKVDMTKVTREYQERGELSTETVTALEKSGLTKGQIETHLRGLKAIASETRREVAGAVGGEEQLDAVRVWAETNLTPAEIKAYDTAVSSGDTALAKLLVQGINARFTEANGSPEPKLLGGEKIPSTTGIKPFASNMEVVQAMKDKRYKAGEPNYVREVERRLAMSSF